MVLLTQYESTITRQPSTAQKTSKPDDYAERDRLNILRIASDLYPDVMGGGAIHAHAMSNHQAARGHSVTVLTSDHPEDTNPGVEMADGYAVVRDREYVRPIGNSITPGVVTSIWNRLPKVDIIHAHSHLYFTSNIAAAIRKVSDTPLIITNHGLISQTAPKWLQKLFIPTIARFTFNAADRVLCYTDTDRQRLLERNITTPIEVVENGIDCDRFTPGPLDRPRRLLFVGRLTDVKGIPVLLEVFNVLADQYPDLELRIVGDGPQRSAYQERCRELGIDDRVNFVGDVPYHEMADHYRQSRIFVLPSRNEGLPRTVLEAMASGTPVVTTALPQLESVVDGAGYTVQAGEVGEFVKTIRRLLDDESHCRELGETGRNRVVSENSWTETVEQTTDVYYDVLSEASD